MKDAVRLAGRCLAVAIVAGAPAALPAQTTRTGMLASAGVSAETNPYNTADADTAVAVTAELRPRVSVRDENIAIDVEGFAQFRQFLSTYGLEDNYGLDANMSSRSSERLNLRATAGASYTEGGYNPFGRPLLSAGFEPTTDPAIPTTIDPGVVVAPGLVLGDTGALLTDVTILGQRARTTVFRGGAGLDYQLTGRSTVSADVNAQALRIDGFGLSDYNATGLELRYSRQVSELTSIGVIGSVSMTDYLGSRVGDATTVSGLVSLDRRFSERWALSVAAGLSRTTLKQLPGQPDSHFTALNVRGRFCRQDELSQLCFSAARSPQPTALGGVRISDAFSADYSRRLSERERLSLGATYTRTGRGRGAALNLPAVDFVSASARYDNRIAERATFFVSGSFGKIYDDMVSRRANIGAAAGIQYRFGALR